MIGNGEKLIFFSLFCKTVRALQKTGYAAVGAFNAFVLLRLELLLVIKKFENSDLSKG